MSQTAAVLKDRGRFYMVHRPFRLAEIFQVLMKYKLEPKRMQLVYPYIDREPNMVLIEALLLSGSLHLPVYRESHVLQLLLPCMGSDRSTKRWKFQNKDRKSVV